MERDLFFTVVNDTIPRVRWKRSSVGCHCATVHLIWAKHLCYKHMKSISALWSKYKHLHNEVYNMTRRDYMHYVDTITSRNLRCSQKPFWNWINKIKACRYPIPSLMYSQ